MPVFSVVLHLVLTVGDGDVMMMNYQVNAIHAFGEQIGTKLARAEELGAEGNVDESLKLMEEVEALKKQKAEAEVCFSCKFSNILEVILAFKTCVHVCVLLRIVYARTRTVLIIAIFQINLGYTVAPLILNLNHL